MSVKATEYNKPKRSA